MAKEIKKQTLSALGLGSGKVQKEEETDITTKEGQVTEMLQGATENLRKAEDSYEAESIKSATTGILGAVQEMAEIKEQSKEEEINDEPITEEVKQQPQKKGPIFNKTANSVSINKGNSLSSRFNDVMSVLKNTSGVMGPIDIYMPHSNLKGRMNPTNYHLKKTKIVNSASVVNMSKSIIGVNRYVDRILEDTKFDPDTKDAKRLLNYKDFKYLVLFNLLAMGEENIELSFTCPKCGESSPLILDIGATIADSMDEDAKGRLRSYDPDTIIDTTATYSYILEHEGVNEKYGEISEVELVVTVKEPSIEKLIFVSDVAVEYIIKELAEDIHHLDNLEESMSDDQMFIEIYNQNKELSNSYMKHFYKFMMIHKISYIFKDSKGMIKAQEDILIDDLSRDNLMRLVNNTSDELLDDVTPLSEDYISEATRFMTSMVCPTEGCEFKNDKMPIDVSLLGFMGAAHALTKKMLKKKS